MGPEMAVRRSLEGPEILNDIGRPADTPTSYYLDSISQSLSIYRQDVSWLQMTLGLSAVFGVFFRTLLSCR